MIRLRTASIALILMGILLLGSNAHAQKFAIVGVVNGEAISNFALHDRISLAIQSSGLENSERVRVRLVPQVLHTMVNEILQRQQAEKLHLKVSDKDLKVAIAELEVRNELMEGGFEAFVEGQGMEKENIINQIKSQILWKKIVSRILHPKLQVSDYEINEVKEQLKSSKGATEVYLSEIVLEAPTKEDRASYKALAEKLIKNINDGTASFSTLAEQFSSSSSAKDGGALGWVVEDHLQDVMQGDIKNAAANSITRPIIIKNTIFIFKVGNRRSGTASVNEERIRSILMQKKLALETRKYLKELRENAFIEIRI